MRSDRGALGLAAARGGIAALQVFAFEIDGGKQLARADPYVIARGELIEPGGDHIRVLVDRGKRLFYRARHAVDGIGRLENPRAGAGDVAINGARGVEIVFRLDAFGHGLRQARLRLRHVRLRNDPDIELLFGVLEPAAQDLLVADVELEHGLIAVDVEIRGRRREQHVLLGRGQLGAARLDEILGTFHRGLGAPTAIKRLGDRDAARHRIGDLVGREEGALIGVIGPPPFAGTGNRRAIVGERLRHFFVCGSQLRARRL